MRHIRYVKFSLVAICLVPPSISQADVLMDPSIYRSAAFAAQGNAVTAQYDSPDLLYVNPASLARYASEKINTLEETFNRLKQLQADIQSCQTILANLPSHPKELESPQRQSSYCILKHHTEIQTIHFHLKDLQASTTELDLNDCLDHNMEAEHGSQCQTKLAKISSEIEETITNQSYGFYAFHLDISDFIYKLVKAKNDEERLMQAVNQKGTPAAAWIGHTATYGQGNWALSLLQSQSFFAIAQFETTADPSFSSDSSNDGLLNLIAQYSKSNIVTATYWQSYPKLSIGYNLHFFNREQSRFREALTNVTTIKNVKYIQRTTAGNGLGVDLGLSYRLTSNLSAGLSILRLGGVSIRRRLKAGESIEKLNQEIRTGLSYHQVLGPVLLQLSSDFIDPSNQNNFSMLRRLSIGGKLCYVGSLCLAGGIRDAYLSTGLGHESEHFSFYFASSGRELSPTALGLIPEKHYQMQLGVVF